MAVNNLLVTGTINLDETSQLINRLGIAVNVYPYNITNILVNCSSSNTQTSINPGDAYLATITADSGYMLDSNNVTIMMGSIDITSTSYNNGEISIANVNANVIINIQAIEIL